MMGKAFLVIDQGTTNSKAVAVVPDGSVRAAASAAVATTYPQPGWVEQDAVAIWRSVEEAVARLLAAHPDLEYDAVAITNQREAAVAWSRSDGRPLGPVVSWQCNRTAAMCRELEAAGLESVLAGKTGLGIDPLYSATKFRWLLDRVERPESDVCVGTMDSWLLWKLSGHTTHRTDVSNASRTQLFNIHDLDWDHELSGIFGVPREVLPECLPSDGSFGTVAALHDRLIGLPIIAVLGDSHAALYGHRASGATAKATYGTGSSVMMTVPSLGGDIAGVSSTLGWGTEAGGVTYALEGNIVATGAAVQWLCDLLEVSTLDLESLAGSVESSGGVVFVPAFSGLGAPHWDAGARGLITGLTRGTGRAELARAVLEAVAFQVGDVFAAMIGSRRRVPDVLFADGAATRNRVLMQLQADVVGIPVAPAYDAEVSAVGAALIGARRHGMSPSGTGSVRHRDPFVPTTTAAERQARHETWIAAVNRARSRAAGEDA